MSLKHMQCRLGCVERAMRFYAIWNQFEKPYINFVYWRLLWMNYIQLRNGCNPVQYCDPESLFTINVEWRSFGLVFFCFGPIAIQKFKTPPFTSMNIQVEGYIHYFHSFWHWKQLYFTNWFVCVCARYIFLASIYVPLRTCSAKCANLSFMLNTIKNSKHSTIRSHDWQNGNFYPIFNIVRNKKKINIEFTRQISMRNRCNRIFHLVNYSNFNGILFRNSRGKKVFSSKQKSADVRSKLSLCRIIKIHI